MGTVTGPIGSITIRGNVRLKLSVIRVRTIELVKRNADSSNGIAEEAVV
jgi:hypothetical protein